MRSALAVMGMVMMVTSCAWMEGAGLWTPSTPTQPGGPTPALDQVVTGLRSVLDLTLPGWGAVWGTAATVYAALTAKGRQNLKRVASPKVGVPETLGAVARVATFRGAKIPAIVRGGMANKSAAR